MSAADLHAEALALIAEQRALIAAGTPGEWSVFNIGIYQMVRPTPEGTAVAVIGIGSIDPPADAALIVAAVNGYEPASIFAKDVLLRHAPDPEPLELMLHMDEECPTGECENGDGHLSVVCRGCYPAWEEMPAHNVWPCPDATAALRSLGLGEPTTSTGGASDAAERKAP